ncbi:hypothetical protein KFE98_12340 [bacterium SCSIO 12741]|nr:hypothetical protein KFE98_12340 [bacterium SCSIO 12741]
MKTRLFLLTLLLVGASHLAHAQYVNDSIPKPVFVPKVGLHLGSNSGMGFSLGGEFKEKFAIILSALPIGSRDQFTLLMGSQLDLKIKDNRTVDIYMGLNTSMWQTTREEWNGFEYTKTTNTTYNAGLAVKGDVSRPTSPAHFQFSVGYGVYDMDDDYIFLPSMSVGLLFDLNL